MTNSPFYADQLAILGYWQQIGGLTMLPGTNRASDRFVRASFYINAVAQSADPKIAVPAVMSVMRNVSVPYGVSTPDKPHIASTRWRTVCDQKNRVYYFEPTLAMETFWVNLAAIDFSKGSGERTLTLAGGQSYAGDVTAKFRKSAKPFAFLFGFCVSAVPGVFVVEAVADTQHQEVGHVEVAQAVSDVDVGTVRHGDFQGQHLVE